MGLVWILGTVGALALVVLLIFGIIALVRALAK
jgi:hypothetical protein